MHLRRKLPQPPSANRKHSPKSFYHASPVAPIKPPHFPRYSCYSATVPFLFLIQHSAQSWWRISDTLVCGVYSVTTLRSRWSLSMVLLKGRVSDTHECTSQLVASIRVIKTRHNLSRMSKTRFLGNTTLRNAVWCQETTSILRVGDTPPRTKMSTICLILKIVDTFRDKINV